MIKIMVKDLCQYAIFEQDGIRLREEILKYYGKGDTITLDFTDISLFATMFFNASIGWLVLKDGAEVVSNNIIYTNLSVLGQATWKHSFENAVEVRANPLYKKALANYTDENQEEEF